MEKILKEGELAIILPVINCLNYTKKMIATIKTKHPYKLILIDNASHDDTPIYFQRLAESENVFFFRNAENIGCAGAWNYGIKYAIEKFDSKYFFIPNNDILLHPLAIDILIKALRHPKSILTTATDVSGRVAQATDVLKMKIPEKTRLTEAPEFSCFMLNKKAIDKVGYFDEKFYPAYFEDNDYHYRIKLAGCRAVKTNKALYFHYGSRTIKDNPDVKEKSNLGYTANREYYKQKWGGKPGEEKYKVPKI